MTRRAHTRGVCGASTEATVRHFWPSGAAKSGRESSCLKAIQPKNRKTPERATAISCETTPNTRSCRWMASKSSDTPLSSLSSTHSNTTAVVCVRVCVCVKLGVVDRARVVLRVVSCRVVRVSCCVEGGYRRGGRQ